MNLDNSIKFTHQSTTLKKCREFFNKNEIIKAFLNGLEKKDERVFLADCQSSQFYAGDRVVRNGTRSRCILMVVTG